MPNFSRYYPNPQPSLRIQPVHLFYNFLSRWSVRRSGHQQHCTSSQAPVCQWTNFDCRFPVTVRQSPASAATLSCISTRLLILLQPATWSNSVEVQDCICVRSLGLIDDSCSEERLRVGLGGVIGATNPSRHTMHGGSHKP